MAHSEGDITQCIRDGHRWHINSQPAPLFPLKTVLCPNGRLTLRIFELRYLDMVSRCLKSDQGLVVVAINKGEETGGEVSLFDVGTYSRIVDFQSLKSGVLGITVEGMGKVSISNAFRQKDGLYLGHIDCLAVEKRVALPDKYSEMAVLLKELCQQFHPGCMPSGIDFEDAREIGWRLIEMLPLSISDSQFLLAVSDPVYRLQQLGYLIQDLAR